MSASRAATKWPVHGLFQARCLHQAPIRRSRLCDCVRAKPAAYGRRQGDYMLVALPCTQRRKQSTSNKPKSNEPLPEIFRRALRQGLSFRPIFGAFRGRNLRELFRQSPEELVVALVLLCGCTAVCAYVVYSYFNYFQSEQFTRFPPDIAKSLRRAIYYTNYAPDPKLAHKYYKLALEQCKGAGLDPFSDEVIGVRIQLAAWLEGIGKFQNSIEVLEALLRDCKGWVELMEKSVAEGLIDNSGRLKAAEMPQSTARTEADESSADEGQPENLWAKRTRVLGKSVGISVKLGELYADEHVLQGDSAGVHLVWAVETVLKELQRRRVDGVKEDEGEWMSPEEIGGALEALGNHYESKSQHYLATPLYLEAISLSPQSSCHTAVLMNNLAISLAQQPISSPINTQLAVGSDESSQTASQAPSRAMLLASARSWALQALNTSEKVTGEDRTEECDEACAVAMCNLGDIAAMSGDMAEAKRRFSESLRLSEKLAFQPGIAQAKDGLKRTEAVLPLKT